tara:strand:+ start:175 stop:603 length:429 start_codon:yes stop_codon:yes gene_type:complete
MKFKRGLGIFLFLIGVFILTSSQSGITGNIVSDRVNAISSIFGLVFIIGGLVLFMAKKSLVSITGSGETIVVSNKFKKSIKNRDIDEVNEALRKIGTTLGKEEFLRHMKEYSIRVNKKDRILFNRYNPREITLDKYDANHYR